MKQISKSLLLLLFVFMLTGCSKKFYPKAEYHKLTGSSNAKMPTSQGQKTPENTLPLDKRKLFTLAATDSVLVYPGKTGEKIYSNYKEFFANVLPGKNYKVAIHTLPDTGMGTHKYLFMPLINVTDNQNKRQPTTITENKWAGAMERQGLKRSFTFNSGDTNQVSILVCADNRELDKMIHLFMMNFVTYKFMTTPTGDFYITIEEIKE